MGTEGRVPYRRPSSIKNDREKRDLNKYYHYHKDIEAWD